MRIEIGYGGFESSISHLLSSTLNKVELDLSLDFSY
jgi:hypothetical protein